MALDGKMIDLATEKKYTEFSKAVKAELHSKLAGHETVKTYAADYDKLQDMKSTFAIIGSPEEQSNETDL